MSDPKLYQIVRWKEVYVSSALNAKFFGILPVGVYKGYALSPSAQAMTVDIDHGADATSVALAERDGYSLTIHMPDTGSITLPGVGEWYICIEAYYIPRGEGYQRIIATQYPETHHVILGRVTVTEDGMYIGADDIDLSDRQESHIADYEDVAKDIDAVIADLNSLTSSVTEINTTQSGGNGEDGSGEVAEGGMVTLPDGMYYYPGSGTLLVFWNGLKLERGENYDEAEAGEDGTANTITIHFEAYEGSKFDFIVLGYSASLGSSDNTGTGTSGNTLTKLAQRVAALETETADIRTELVMPDAAKTFEDELQSEDDSNSGGNEENPD